MLSALGAGRASGVVALETVPVALVAAIVGWGVGWAGVAVVAGAGGLADRLGITAPVSIGSIVATAGAAVLIVGVIGVAATVTAAIAGERRLARRDEGDERGT